MFGGEEVGCDCQGDDEVAAQLEVSVREAALVCVFVVPAEAFRGLNPVVRLYMRADARGPVAVQQPLAGNVDAAVGEVAGGVQVGKEGDGGVHEAGNLDRRAVARRARDAPVARPVRRAHLVHPSAAVPPVAPKNEPCAYIEPRSDVKAVRLHMCVDFRPFVPFTKTDTVGVRLHNGLDYLVQLESLVAVCPEVVVLTVAAELECHFMAEDVRALRAQLDVVLDGLEEPPGGVPGVKARVVPRVEQVRNQPVAEDRGEGQYYLAGLLKPPSD